MTQEILSETETEKTIHKSVKGHNITTIQNYESRNRTHKAINPFYITENGKYIAGALIGNTPGNTKPEQIKYLANMLKLNPNTNIIQTSFHNSNGWFIFNFKYIFDLEECLNKINKKNKKN